MATTDSDMLRPLPINNTITKRKHGRDKKGLKCQFIIKTFFAKITFIFCNHLRNTQLKIYFLTIS